MFLDCPRASLACLAVGGAAILLTLPLHPYRKPCERGGAGCSRMTVSPTAKACTFSTRTSTSCATRGGGARRRSRAGVAVGVTAILLHPPSTFSRRFNSDKKGAVSYMRVSPTARRVFPPHLGVRRALHRWGAGECLSLPCIALPLPLYCLSLTCHCFPRARSFSLSRMFFSILLSLPVACVAHTFHCLYTVFP